jgi:hypothetical protein
MTPKDFDDLKAIHYASLKEYVDMISAVPGSLRTGLTGEQIAAEIIMGALFLKTFMETGKAPPLNQNEAKPLQFSN